MITLTEEHKAAIVKAEKTMEKVDKLLRDIDDLLTPVADLVKGSQDPVEIRALADLLPAGFYRSELRTLALFIERSSK